MEGEVLSDSERAAFWVDFIVSKCMFPKPELLKAQFEHAELVFCCKCGCDSFDVNARDIDKVPPLTNVGRCLVYDVSFRIRGKDSPLEILLWTGESNRLDWVEMVYYDNDFPIAGQFEIEEPPIYVNISEFLTI